MPSQKGSIHIPLVFILLVVVALGSALLVNQPTNQDVKGTLIAKDDESSSGSSGSGSSGSGSSGSDSSGSSGSNSSGSSSDSNDDKSDSSSGSSGSTTTKTTTPEGIRVETKTSEEKQKTEVRFGKGEKIKTRVEEGRTRIDVYSGGVKVRYEIRDDRVVIKAETEDGEEVEEEEIVKIVDRLDKTGIKIATEGGKLLVARNQVGALSNFPLQVDLNTNQLIVTTPAGIKTVTTLPDQAVQNMLAANVISRLGPSAIVEAAREGQVATVSGIIQLGIRNNVPVYEIPGIRDFRLLGFIPISAPVTAVVSADSGQLVTTEQPLLTRIVDLLSP